MGLEGVGLGGGKDVVLDDVNNCGLVSIANPEVFPLVDTDAKLVFWCVAHI